MAKNFDIPLDNYLESFLEGVLRKNPDLPLGEVASIAFQNNRKLRHDIESGNTTGIPQSIRKAFNEAVIRESEYRNSGHTGNSPFADDETPVLLADAQLQLTNGGYSSSKNQELAGQKKSDKNYGNLINQLQKYLETDPRYQLMSSFEIPQKAIPEAVSALGIPQFVQKIDKIHQKKEMEKQDSLKRVEKKWTKEKGEFYEYTTLAGTTVEFTPGGINKPVGKPSLKYEEELDKKWHDLGAIKIGERTTEYNCFADVLIGRIGWLDPDKADTILRREFHPKFGCNEYIMKNLQQSRKNVMATKVNQGDVVVYYEHNPNFHSDEKRKVHIAEVLGVYDGKIYVLSKVADLGTYIHEMCNVPSNYSGGFSVYRRK